MLAPLAVGIAPVIINHGVFRVVTTAELDGLGEIVNGGSLIV